MRVTENDIVSIVVGLMLLLEKLSYMHLLYILF